MGLKTRICQSKFEVSVLAVGSPDLQALISMTGIGHSISTWCVGQHCPSGAVVKSQENLAMNRKKRGAQLRHTSCGALSTNASMTANFRLSDLGFCCQGTHPTVFNFSNWICRVSTCC